MKMTWMDNQKRQWSCRFTIEDAKRLKAAGTDIADPESFKTIFANRLTTIELFAELMRPQWESQGLRYEEFAELLIESDGRIDEVHAAFVDGLTDFFRRLGEPWMAEVVNKAKAAVDRSREARMARAQSNTLDELLSEVAAAEEKLFAKEVENVRAKISGGTLPS